MEITDYNLDTLKNISENDVHFGSMRISKPQFKALLVFSKNDQQCLTWKESLEKLGFTYDVASTESSALECFRKNQHHLIVIDDQCVTIDSKRLCRSLRSSYFGSFSTIVAIVSRRNETDGNSVTRDLLDAGFNQLINATTNIKDVEDTLLQLEAGPLTLQFKFRSCQAVFSALERSRDLIQIADEKYQIQYVNKMYQQVTGFTVEQVVGQNLSYHFVNEANEEDSWQRIKADIHTGKEWHGDLYMKQKEGEDLQFHVVILPLTDHDGTVLQYVIVSQLPSNNMDGPGSRRIFFHDPHRRPSGTSEPLPFRRSSNPSSHEGDRRPTLARIHYMSIEAPIIQIIKLISQIKESSQPLVSEVLHRILDILRNSELYAPSDLSTRTSDPILMDFVEGLVRGTGFGRRLSGGGTSDSGLGRSPPSGGMRSGGQTPTIAVADPMIAACLVGSDSWNYDILALERITSKKPLVHLGMHILNQYDVCDVLSCTPTTLHSWLVAIESKYHASNPYHNSTHAADVLHATAYFLRKERVKMWMEQVDAVASLLAAIIHDVDHPGRTNAFLVNSNNPLALLYNDTAVLESHHAAFAFNFTINSETCNIFKNTSKDLFRNLRQSMIDMVLATELSKHFEHVNKFISVVTKNNNDNGVEQESPSPSGNRSSGTNNPSNAPELKLLIKRIMIKVADVINPARETSLCVEWARRIAEEYFSQTDQEKQLGLPVVMPHFDRNTCSLPKSQMTFMEYFLNDMCEAWHEFCGVDEVMANLYDNYNYWKKLQQEGVMKISDIDDSKRTTNSNTATPSTSKSETSQTSKFGRSLSS